MSTGRAKGEVDIWTRPLDLSDPDHPKPGKPEPFLRAPFNEVLPSSSPDGRWLAYTSSESGISQVYVRAFPGPGRKWLISTGSGIMPIWSRNGRELFYRTGEGRIMVATYTTKGEAVLADQPRLWSEKQLTDVGIYSKFRPCARWQAFRDNDCSGRSRDREDAHPGDVSL